MVSTHVEEAPVDCDGPEHFSFSLSMFSLSPQSLQIKHVPSITVVIMQLVASCIFYIYGSLPAANCILDLSSAKISLDTLFLSAASAHAAKAIP